MRTKVLIIALAALVGAGAAAINAYTQQEAQPLDISEVADGLYMIVGAGGNVAVRVTDDGVVVVDDKFEQDYDGIIERIESVTDQPVRYVLNTHHHGDHAGSNAQFAEIAQIVAHRNVRENIIRGNQSGPPSIVYSDAASVFLGEIEVEAHHVGRGHTNGDSVILFPDLGVIHTGDLFVGSAPYIDYGNGGSAVEWLTTLDNILQLEFETVIPGHGSIMTREDIREFRGKMLTMQLRARGLISEGVSREDFPSRLDVSDLGWNYSGGFAASSIPSLYDELTE
jgi:glyoxylase-like metal-dependent hydrolase (beta-lactamase superfamily II)